MDARRGTRAPVVRAASWMGGALLSLAMMAVAGRELAAELSPFQILLFRNVVALAVLAVILGPRGWRRVQTAHPGTHLKRNLLHFLGGCGWFYGLAHLPLAQVFAIEFTVPVWTALLAAWLLGERITAARRTAIALGLAGVWLILRPGVEVVSPAALAVLGGAVAYAGSYILTKRLSATDAPVVVLFHMAAIQLPLALGPALVDWRLPSLAAWPWILSVGLTTLAAHFCITRALALADATVVIPLDFLRLPLIALVGYAYYRETIDWWVLAGASVMVAGNLYSLRREAASASKRLPVLSQSTKRGAPS
jgi:drug/metabolite transporter (DMT)-like permease